jgi:hypothetical protein
MIKAASIKEPDFISKAELMEHLRCDWKTIDRWIADGQFPPPHSRPGKKHPLWLRSHYRTFVETGEWPEEAFVRYVETDSPSPA